MAELFSMKFVFGFPIVLVLLILQNRIMLFGAEKEKHRHSFSRLETFVRPEFELFQLSATSS